MLILTLMLGSRVPAAHAADAEPRFNIAVINAPAKSFFLALVRDTPYNMVVHPEVSGEISLDLKQVTVPEVLEMTRELYGYDYRKLSAGYLVLPATLQTRMFYVNYVDLERTGSSRTRVTSGQSSSTGGQNGQNGGTNGGTNGGGQTGNNSSDTPGQSPTGSSGNGNRTAGGSQTGSVIETRYKVDFWTELALSLEQLIPKDAAHSVVVNAQSGVIAVRAMPNELNDVAKFLAKIQSTAGRQVILEAKIIEVDLNNDFQAGINWSALLSNGSQQYLIGQQSPSSFSADLLAPSGPTVTVAPGNPIPGLISNTLGGAFTLGAQARDFAAYVNLLQVQGNTRVLSSPRVSTLNNQKAVIKSGSDEFFVTNVTSNTVTSTAASTSNSIELTSFFSGVALDVTPQIDDDGSVILHIHPTVSAVTSQNLSVTYAGQTDTLPLALSQIRESDSVIKARSGQVVVIGGLMTTHDSQINYQTPGLGSIPILGNLFKSKQTTHSKTELVILLKPIVVDDNNEAWKPIVKSAIDQAKKLDPAVDGSLSTDP
jgi:MSHA biogenesis protein MshL